MTVYQMATLNLAPEALQVIINILSNDKLQSDENDPIAIISYQSINKFQVAVWKIQPIVTLGLSCESY